MAAILAAADREGAMCGRLGVPERGGAITSGTRGELGFAYIRGHRGAIVAELYCELVMMMDH